MPVNCKKHNLAVRLCALREPFLNNNRKAIDIRTRRARGISKLFLTLRFSKLCAPRTPSSRLTKTIKFPYPLKMAGVQGGAAKK